MTWKTLGNLESENQFSGAKGQCPLKTQKAGMKEAAKYSC